MRKLLSLTKLVNNDTRRLPHYRSDREYESNISEARIQKGLKIKELCDKIDMHHSMYSRLNSGMISPINRSGHVKPEVIRLVEALDLTLSDAFPRYFCEISKDIDSFPEMIIEHFHRGLLDPDYDDPELKLLATERRKKLQRVFDGLTDRQQYVVIEHFVNERTLKDISKSLSLSSNRISVILKEAIRRFKYLFLRSPTCKYLFEECLNY